jgi:hypothetical protein
VFIQHAAFDGVQDIRFRDSGITATIASNEDHDSFKDKGKITLRRFCIQSLGCVAITATRVQGWLRHAKGIPLMNTLELEELLSLSLKTLVEFDHLEKLCL